MQIPVLMTDRLTLRPYSPADLNNFVALNANSEVRRHIGGPIAPERVAQKFQSFVTGECEPGNEVWAATLTATGEYAGHCWFGSPTTADCSEIGYIIKPTLWRRRFATEIVRRLVEYAIVDCARQRVSATVDVDHIASIRVLERVGFIRSHREVDDDGPHFVYHFDPNTAVGGRHPSAIDRGPIGPRLAQ